jgi:hypothetical protein
MTELQDARLEKAPAPANDIKVEVIDGELLLYHPRQTMAVYLNPPAAVIWSLCDGQRPVREIIGLIEQSYPESKENLTEEVLATLADLYEKKVLVAG